MKYPPTPEEIEARQKDSYRTQINSTEVRCHGISHMLDKYTVLREPHKTLGINLPPNPSVRFDGQRILLTCDECFSAQKEDFDQHLAEHPEETYGEPVGGDRAFYYKGKYYGDHKQGNYKIKNGTKFRFTHPSTYTEIRIPRKTKDAYGRRLPRVKPEPLKTFTTSEEFYAYLETESTTQP